MQLLNRKCASAGRAGGHLHARDRRRCNSIREPDRTPELAAAAAHSTGCGTPAAGPHTSAAARHAAFRFSDFNSTLLCFFEVPTLFSSAQLFLVSIRLYFLNDGLEVFSDSVRIMRIPLTVSVNM